MLTDQPARPAQPMSRIVIVGEGLAAWLTASALARSLNKVVNSIAVCTESNSNAVDDSLGAPSIAEASLPSMATFNQQIGYNENGLIAVTHGGFTLGTAISELGKGAPAFNPFGEVGAVLGPVNFQQLILRARDLGQPEKFANYSLAALCAQAGRFAKPAAQDHSVLSSLAYGLHIDVAAYAQVMKADAVARGVKVHQSGFRQAARDEAGVITAVTTNAGQQIEGDLFIDCTGPARKLAAIAHESRFVEWSQWLPCNRVTHTVIPTTDVPVYTHLAAEASGWSRTIALQGHRTESRCLRGAPDSSAKAHIFKAGYNTAPWQHNCIALGGASATIDPVASLSLHLLHSGIQRLITLIPNDRLCVQEAIEFNRQTIAELECARDYTIAHYKLNGRVGEPFWDECRNMSVPDSLARRISVYQNCGRIALRDGEVVDSMNWLALFDAQGMQPAQYDVVTRAIPVNIINEHLSSLRQTMLNTINTLPTYKNYLQQLQGSL